MAKSKKRTQHQKEKQPEPQPVEVPDIDHYEVLEISRTATKNDIRAAYRRLSSKYHPDKNPDGAEKFKEVNRAHEILSDDEKRQVYDTFGSAGLENSESGLSQWLSSETVEVRWGKSAALYMASLILNWLFGVPIDQSSFVAFSIYASWMLDITNRYINGGIFVIDVLLYYILPQRFLSASSNILMYLSAILYGNTVKQYWDISILAFAIACGIDYTYDRYPNTMGLLSAHTLLVSSCVSVLSFLYYKSTPVPEKKGGSSMKKALSSIYQSSEGSIFLMLLVWHVVYVLDYFLNFQIEWLPLSILSLTISKDWPLKYNGIYVSVVSGVHYLLPSSLVRFLSQFLLYIMSLLLLCISYFSKDIKNGVMSSYGVKGVFKRIPKAYWAVSCYLFYIDFFYRIRPDTWNIFASTSLVWGFCAAGGVVFNMIIPDDDEQEEEGEEEEREDKGRGEREETRQEKKKKPCQQCGSTKKTKKCSGCGRVYYCSVECQKEDRANHKRHCHPPPGE